MKLKLFFTFLLLFQIAQVSALEDISKDENLVLKISNQDQTETGIVTEHRGGNGVATEHRGGNGGEGDEVLLKIIMMKIGIFLKSSVGREEFQMIDIDRVAERIETTKYALTTDELKEKINGQPRTCLNYLELNLVRCNLAKVQRLIDLKMLDVLYVLIAHEILNLEGYELGFKEVVSQYPISGKLIPYTKLIKNISLQKDDLDQQLEGVDARSYGFTFQNMETTESVRMVCLDDFIPVEKCRSFTLVRTLNGKQMPVYNEQRVITKEEVQKFNFNLPNEAELQALNEKLSKMRTKGYDWVTLGKRGQFGDYMVGVWDLEKQDSYGNSYAMASDLTVSEQFLFNGALMFTLIRTVPAVVNLTTEVGKSVLNTILWPFKSLMNGAKIVSAKDKRVELQKEINRVKSLLNSDNKLSMINKQQGLSNDDYDKLIRQLKMVMMAVK